MVMGGSPRHQLGRFPERRIAAALRRASALLRYPTASPPRFERRLARSLEDAARFPSFAEYMKSCLYDPNRGYYSTGRVRFGCDGHFWTFPQRMSPIFGALLAEAIRPLLTAREIRPS